MRFEDKAGIIYCKDDSYNEKYDNNAFYVVENAWYWLGYLVNREDGPAIEFSSGIKYYFFKGKLHREDGPAVEWHSGEKSWYLNGQYYEEKNYWKIIKLKNKNRVLDEI